MRLDSPHHSNAPELDSMRALRLIGRALRLRCPRCGTRGIFASWTRLKDRCPGCGIPLERRESDYFIGAYLVNLVAVEILLALIILVVLLSFDTPPWDAVEIIAPIMMIVGAIACYPFAKTTWLAVDLLWRPMSDEELATYEDNEPRA
jgi:uncharacterized protein (DUF983 family)